MNISEPVAVDEQCVPVRFLPFGPQLMQTMVDPKVIEELLERGHKTKESHASDLAGHIDTQNKFTADDMQWFVEAFRPYFQAYFKDEKTVLTQLWVNFMQAGEFNPVHYHTTDFSFVVYLQIPEGIEQEVRQFKGAGQGPGVITFFHGEIQQSTVTQHHFLPVECGMFVFPATLRHSVAPFHSDGTRISISGNLNLASNHMAQQLVEERIREAG